MKRQLALNSLSSTGLLVANVLISFLLTPVIVREIGNTDYGIWEILVGLIGYLNLLDLGVSPAVVRFVAVAVAENDRNRQAAILSTSFIFLLGAGVIALAVMSGLALAPQFILNVPQSQTADLGIVFLLVGLNLLLQIPGSSIVGYLYGIQRHTVVNVLRVALGTAGSVAAYLALTRLEGRGLFWLALTALLPQLVLYGLLMIYVFKRSYGGVPRIGSFSVVLLKEMWGFGIKNLLLMLASRIRKQSMPIIITHAAAVDRVVFYAVPNRLVESAWGLGAALGQPVTPFFSTFHGRGDAGGLLRNWYILTRTLQFLLFGIPILIIALGPAFIARWLGATYADHGLIPIVLLSSALFFEALAPSAISLLVSQARHGAAARVAVVCAVINVLIAVPFTVMWGVPGASLALFLTGSVAAVLTMRLACRSLGISVAEHLRRTALPLAPAVGVLVSTLIGIRLVHSPDSYVELLLSSATAMSLYGFTAWHFALSHQERSILGAAIASRLRLVLHR